MERQRWTAVCGIVLVHLVDTPASGCSQARPGTAPSYYFLPAMSDASPSLSTLFQPVTLSPTPLSVVAWVDHSAGEVALTPSPIIAQQFDQDILGDLSNAWHNFIDSGQVWALIIGIVLGYLIRNLTAY